MMIVINILVALLLMYLSAIFTVGILCYGIVYKPENIIKGVVDHALGDDENTETATKFNENLLFICNTLKKDLQDCVDKDE